MIDSKNQSTNNELALIDENILKQLETDTSPEILLKVLTVFANETLELLEKIELSISRHDLISLQNSLHSLKGTTSTFGAKRLHALVQSAESACLAGKLKDIIDQWDTIKKTAKQTLAYLATR